MATKKTTAKKPVVKKTATKTIVKKAAVKKAAPKTAAKKTAVKKAPVKKVAAKKVVTKKTAAKLPAGIPEQLRDAALKILEERQAEDVVSVDLRGKSAMADYVIVATGRSGRQLAAIADYLRLSCETIAKTHPRIEGLPQGDWVLIDAGDVIVHLFRPEVRSYYRIEDIWSLRSPK